MKKILSVVLAIIMVATVLPLAFAAETETVVLYTNDVHCAIDDYAVLAAYKAQLESEGKNVVLVDAGDAIQGEVIGALTKGEAVVDVMNAVGYDYAIPGNHEFDYGMEVFLDLAENMAQYEYISSNFHYLPRASSAFEPYAIEDFGDFQIAFVGISTPETITKSTPDYFKDENGNFIYGFPQYPGEMTDEALYESVQESVDEAIADGADIVIALGHMGITGTTEGWKSTDIIANTDGIDYFIDAHSEEIIEGSAYKNAADEDVVLTSTGSKFAYFGVMTINGDSVDFELVNPDDVDVDAMSESAKTAYDTVKGKIDGYNEEIEYLYEPIGTSDVVLHTRDEDYSWAVRKRETNAGDFVADAYKAVTGADVAIVNGGGIRQSIGVGDVSRKMLMDLNPFGNEMCVLEVSGQQLIDVLEHGARKCPESLGSFFQVSGVTFEIHSYLDSPVISDQLDNFMGVDESMERRVQNVYVNGDPIDLDGTYTLAGSQYVLTQDGDGLTMLEGATVVQADGLPCDYEMLIEYFTDYLDGVIPEYLYGDVEGDGRITIYGDFDVEPDYEISYGETITIQAPLFDEETFTYIKFVPEQDGKYVLQSNAEEIDTVCYLYNNVGVELSFNDDAEDLNFRVKNDFVAGKTYYFAVAIYSEDYGNEFEVSLSCGHNYENGVCGVCGAVCNHECADDNFGFCQCGAIYCGMDIQAGFEGDFSMEGGSARYFRFVPEESGAYIFGSSSDADPMCILYDSDFNEKSLSDDDVGYNFIMVCNLEEGKPYYFEVMLLGDEGNVNLRLERAVHTAEDGSEHPIYLYYGAPASCIENSYSTGFYCQECEVFVWGGEKQSGEHTDWDEDGFCDECGAEITYTFWEKIELWFDNLFMEIRAFFAEIILRLVFLFM